MLDDPAWTGVLIFDCPLEYDQMSPAEMWAERAALYPTGRGMAAREVADVTAFPASEEPSGVNGEAITVALGGIW